MSKRYLNEQELKIVSAMQSVTFLPGSYDKRFFRNMTAQGFYSEKQISYLHFIFNKYRRQIKNYEQLAFEFYPERFAVNVDFLPPDLFNLSGSAEVNFKDTFKPKRFNNPNQ